jgi:hypothetical protein
MRYKYLSLLILAAAVSACDGDLRVSAPPPPPPTVLLKDIVIPNLPSPYYHFEYDAGGRVSAASFASGFTMYDVSYDGDRISELHNNTAGNRDRLLYLYDGDGRVTSVRYVDVNGVVSTVLFLSYDGGRLTAIERDRRVAGGFLIDKTMSFTYHADGNLFELKEHRPAIDGFQPETTTMDRFEQYDDGINVDGFSLIHNDFFDHLVLLPAVQLQKGNPRRETFSGDGDNYTVDYTYTYDAGNRPLTKSGDFTFLTGQDAGKHFPTLSIFSYY